MTLLLSLLIGASWAAPATNLGQAGASVPLVSAWVLIDQHAWLYEAPREDAVRMRAVDVGVAPEYRSAPVLVARRVERRGEWVRVRTAAHAGELSDNGMAKAPDAVPENWPLCYPQPAAIQQLDLDVWVHASDLLSVLTRAVEVSTPDGGTVSLSPGLAVSGRNGTYRVRAHHLTVVANLPDDAVGTAFEIGLPPPRATRFIASSAKGSFLVHPTWRATIDARGADIVIPPSTEADPSGAPTTLLTDRCVTLRPAAPGPAVPAYDATLLADGSTWPILIPEGTQVHRRRGTSLGEVRGGPFVLWSRASCVWSEETGLCCDPLYGTESEGEGDRAVCFDANLPTQVDRSPNSLFAVKQDQLALRTNLVAALRASVTWSRPEVRGFLSADDIEEVLRRDAKSLTYCYERSLQHDPSVEGTLDLRFGVPPDGRPRQPTVTASTIEDPELIDCVTRRMVLWVIANQVGENASVVDMQFRFRGEPVPAGPE